MPKKLIIFFIAVCLFFVFPTSPTHSAAATSVIVAETSLLHNSGNLPATNLFTTSVEDTYLVTVVMSTGAAPTSSTTGSGLFNWTDERSPKEKSTGSIFIVNGPSFTIDNQQSFSFPLHVAALSNITFQLTWNTPSQAPDYDLYFVVEQY